MAIALTWPQVLAWRMRRHHLVERAAPDDMLDVAARIGGLHAQVMSSAELTLHARVDGLERDAVAAALWEDRSLVNLGHARHAASPPRRRARYLAGCARHLRPLPEARLAARLRDHAR